MKTTRQRIDPEHMIRVLANGIAAGIVVVAIYSAQALFTQPEVRTPSTPAATTTSAPAPATVAPAEQPAAAETAAPAAQPAAEPAAPTPPAEPGSQQTQLGKALAILGTGLLLAGSALLGGAFVGFLFGIPKALQPQEGTEVSPPQNAAAAEQPAKGVAVRTSYGANTSLEQISDWLTKILVGVGLTQLSSIPDALAKFAAFARPGLGDFTTSGLFADALLIYFLICGFLASYLWTRLTLGKAFTEADALAEIRGEIETAVVSELQKKAQGQMTTDYEALMLTQKQLESGGIPQEALNKALSGTSDLYRSHIFQMASSRRSQNWAKPENKPRMERTIPIFRALIDTDDKKAPYYQNYAQLGFALAEAAKPDYAEAVAALDKAIDLRGEAEAHGYLWLEFVRAKCQADPEATDPATKKKVLEDLELVLRLWPELDRIIEEDTRLSTWMKANHVTMKNLSRHATQGA